MRFLGVEIREHERKVRIAETVPTDERSLIYNRPEPAGYGSRLQLLQFKGSALAEIYSRPYTIDRFRISRYGGMRADPPDAAIPRLLIP